MASQLVTVDVGHVLERAEVEGRIGNEAGQKELQKLAPSRKLDTWIQEGKPPQLMRLLETKPGMFGCGAFAEGLTAYGVGPTPECSENNAVCAVYLTYRYLNDSLEAFVDNTGQPPGVLEKVARCFEPGWVVGERVVRVCRGCEIPALPWGREALRFVGLRRPVGQEPETMLAGPTREIREKMEKHERRWRRLAGLPVVTDGVGKDSTGGSGTTEQHGRRAIDRKTPASKVRETEDSSTEGRAEERSSSSTADRRTSADAKSVSVQHDEGEVSTRASVVVQEASSKEPSAFKRTNIQSGSCTKTHLPPAYRKEAEFGEFGEQWLRHYNMIWAAMKGCVTCVKAYQEAGGSRMGEKYMDVWSGTRNNVKFNAWRASYVRQSINTVIKQEEVREYLRSLDGSDAKIEWTRHSELWEQIDHTESMSVSLLEQAEGK